MDATIRSSAEGAKVAVLQSFKLATQVLNGVASFFLHWTLEPGYLRARRARMAAVPPSTSTLGALDSTSVDALASYFLSAGLEADGRSPLARSSTLLPPELLRQAREEFSWVSGGNRLEATGEFTASQFGTASAPGLVAEARIALLVLIDTAASQMLQCCRPDEVEGGRCRRRCTCGSRCCRQQTAATGNSITRAALGRDSIASSGSATSLPMPSSAAHASPMLSASTDPVVPPKSRLLAWLPNIRISLPQDSLPPPPGSLSGAAGAGGHKALRRRSSALGVAGELSALNSPVMSPLLAPAAASASSSANGGGLPPMSLPAAAGLSTAPSSFAADGAHSAHAASSATPPLPFPTLPTPSGAFCPLPRISDVSTTAALLQRRLNLPVECFAAVTADGYVLTLIRIPRLESKRVVFFQHGLLDSASAWLSTGSVLSLAARAYAAGCDVFMGNLRGSNDALGSNGLGANPADYAELDEAESGAFTGSIALQMQQMARAAQAGAASAMAAAAAAASSAAATAAASAAKALPAVSEGLQEAMTRVGSVASLAGLGSARDREARDAAGDASVSTSLPGGADGGPKLHDSLDTGSDRAAGIVASAAPRGPAKASAAVAGSLNAARGTAPAPLHEGDDDAHDDSDGDESRAGGVFCRVRGQPGSTAAGMGVGAAAGGGADSTVGRRSRAASSTSVASVSFVGSSARGVAGGNDTGSIVGIATPPRTEFDSSSSSGGLCARARSGSAASIGSTASVGSVGFAQQQHLPGSASGSARPSSASGSASEQLRLVSPLRGQLARSRTHVALADASTATTEPSADASAPAAAAATAAPVPGGTTVGSIPIPPRIRRTSSTSAGAATSDAAHGAIRTSSVDEEPESSTTVPLPPQAGVGVGGPTAAVRVAAALGTSAEGLPVHLHLHPRQQQFWAYDVTDHGLDIMAFMRQIRIIKAVEAPLRRRLRAANADTAASAASTDAAGASGAAGAGSATAGASAGGSKTSSAVDGAAAASTSGTSPPQPHQQQQQHYDEEAELRRLTSGRPVDATSPLADDCVITGVGHSMGGCVLLLHVLMSRALRRPHWLRKLVLLSPAGLHKHTPWPSKALLYALDAAGLLRAERPFPMRSSRLQRLGAHLLQDLKQMAGVGDLMAVAASYFFGGERFNFSFRHVSFTDYPIGGTSHRVLRHGIQNVKARDFVPYNYGSRENRERYGAAQPPSIRDDFGLLADDGGVDIAWIGGGLDLLVPPANLEEQHRLVLAIQRLARSKRATSNTVADAGQAADAPVDDDTGAGGASASASASAEAAATGVPSWMQRGGRVSSMLTFPRAGHLDFSLTISDAIISHILEEIDSAAAEAEDEADADSKERCVGAAEKTCSDRVRGSAASAALRRRNGRTPANATTAAGTSPAPAALAAGVSDHTPSFAPEADAAGDATGESSASIGLDPDVRDIAHRAVDRLSEYYADGGGSGRWRPARECALRHRWLFGLTKLDVALEALDAEAREMGLAPAVTAGVATSAGVARSGSERA